MEESQICEAVARLCAVEYSTLNAYGLDRVKDDFAAVKSWTDAVSLRIGRRGRELAAAGQCGSPKDLLAPIIGTAEARNIERRNDVADALPELGDALEAGTVCGTHLDKAGRAMAGLTDAEREALACRGDEIAAIAASSTPDQFGHRFNDMVRDVQAAHGSDAAEQCRRKRRIVTRDGDDGMKITELHADPESHARIQAVITKARELARQRRSDGDERDFDQIVFDEVIDMLTNGAFRNTRGEPIGADVTVLIDAETLRTGQPHEATVCEYRNGDPVPVHTVRRYCCDANIAIALLNEHGVILNLGRTERLANRDQRRALRAMYRTCAHPTCTVAFEKCRIHHIVWWEHNGPTDLNVLVPLCNEHHTLVHEGGWDIRFADPDTRRELHWYRPDGTLAGTGLPDATKHGNVTRLVPEREREREPEPPPGGQPSLFHQAS